MCTLTLDAMEGFLKVFVSSFISGQWLCEVERFDPRTNQWALIEPMHHSRTGVAVTALKGQQIHICTPTCSFNMCVTYTYVYP